MVDKYKDQELKPLELALIQGLLNWQDKTSEGWKTMNQILKDSLDWKSQRTNFPKYMQSLVKRKIAQQRIYTEKDSRNRVTTKKQWRLNKTQNAWKSIVSAVSIHYAKHNKRPFPLYPSTYTESIKNTTIKAVAKETNQNILFNQIIETKMQIDFLKETELELMKSVNMLSKSQKNKIMLKINQQLNKFKEVMSRSIYN
jgi:hypothetical protein